MPAPGAGINAGRLVPKNVNPLYMGTEAIPPCQEFDHRFFPFVEQVKPPAGIYGMRPGSPIGSRSPDMDAYYRRELEKAKAQKQQQQETMYARPDVYGPTGGIRPIGSIGQGGSLNTLSNPSLRWFGGGLQGGAEGGYPPPLGGAAVPGSGGPGIVPYQLNSYELGAGVGAGAADRPPRAVPMSKLCVNKDVSTVNGHMMNRAVSCDRSSVQVFRCSPSCAWCRGDGGPHKWG